MPFGARGGAVRSGTVLQARKSWVQFPIGSLRFFHCPSFWLHYGPGVNSVEYQGYLVGRGKSGRRGADCLDFLGASTHWNPEGLYRDCFTSYMPFTHFFVKCTSYRHVRSIFLTRGSLHHESMLIKRSNLVQQYADIYLLQSHSTCFGRHSTHHQEH